jgi:hypothetical protein
MKEAIPGEKQKFCGEPFAQEFFFILHSSPVEENPFFTCGGEEWNSQSSENGLSAFQGESVPRAHSLKIENGKKEVRQPLLSWVVESWLNNH